MGIEGTYKVTLKSQLGPKYGFFCFKKVKGKLFVTFTLLGHENTLMGSQKSEGFEIDGNIVTPLGLRRCRIQGALINRSIDAEITIGGRIYPLTGVKLDNNVKGENK